MFVVFPFILGRPRDGYIFQQDIDMTSILKMTKRQRRRTRVGIQNHADYVIIYANVGRVFTILSLSLTRYGEYVLEKVFELKHKVSVVCSYGEELALRSKGRWDVYQLLEETGGPVIPMNPPCPQEYECTALKLMKLLKYGSVTVLAQIQIYEGRNYRKDLVVRYDESRTNSSDAVNITLGNVRKIAEDNKRRLALFSADREGNVIILLTGGTGKPIRVCYHWQNISYARQCLPVIYPGLGLRATPNSASMDEANERFILTVLLGRKMLLLNSVDLSCFKRKKKFIKPDIQAPSAIKQDLMFLGHGWWGDIVQVKKRAAGLVTIYRPVLAFR
ncbi:uncharacterized protein LOC135494793 [Lineus longissimus]|uniref:uncharacterized protein LOC135494793 n=1 Tax=Lineus longissimus TaxID=88925 RepID=UPI00315D3C85